MLPSSRRHPRGPRWSPLVRAAPSSARLAPSTASPDRLASRPTRCPPAAPAPAPRRASRLRCLRSPLIDALALGILSLAVRLPFQTTVLYHWDSILYARALADFDVSESQPHPPGYLFYVAAARLAQFLLGDPNASLVAVSLLAATIAVPLAYAIGRRLFGRAVGVGAALLLATSPTFWFYSGVAYPYTVLAAGSLGLTALAIAYWRGQWSHPALLGLALGLAGGFRLDLCVFMAPLIASAHAVHCRRTGRWSDLVALPAAALLGLLAWLAPTAVLSQGWDVYGPLLAQQSSYVGGSYSVWARGGEALQSNSWQVLVYAWEGLQLAIVPLAYVLARGARHVRALARAPDGHTAFAPVVLGLWLAPPVAFYALVHIGDRGYSFTYLPALCILAAVGTRALACGLVRCVRTRGVRPTARLAARRPVPIVFAGLLAASLLANLATFLLGHGRISAFEVDCLNRAMPRTFALLHEHFDPADTLIFASFFYQHARHYAPEFPAWWYDPLTRPVFREPLPTDVRHVVVLGDAIRPARQPNLSFYPLPCDRRLYYFSPVEPGARLVFRPPALAVRSAP